MLFSRFPLFVQALKRLGDPGLPAEVPPGWNDLPAEPGKTPVPVPGYALACTLPCWASPGPSSTALTPL